MEEQEFSDEEADFWWKCIISLNEYSWAEYERYPVNLTASERMQLKTSIQNDFNIPSNVRDGMSILVDFVLDKEFNQIVGLESDNE